MVRPLLSKSSLGIAFLLTGAGWVVASFLYSFVAGNGEWFQRSGSLAVLISVIVEIQQATIKEPKSTNSVYIGGAPAAVVFGSGPAWLHWAARIGIVVGTGIWGYGDLVF